MVQYIGTATNVDARIKKHLNPYYPSWIARDPVYQKFDENWKDIYSAVRRDKFRFERLLLEAKLIYRLRPALNTHYREGL